MESIYVVLATKIPSTWKSQKKDCWVLIYLSSINFIFEFWAKKINKVIMVVSLKLVLKAKEKRQIKISRDTECILFYLLIMFWGWWSQSSQWLFYINISIVVIFIIFQSLYSLSFFKYLLLLFTFQEF